MYCKYQLIRYKPWRNPIENLWENVEATDELFCEKWSLFLKTELSQTLVPKWRRQLSNVEAYFSIDNSDLDEDLAESEGPREEWMYLADLCNSTCRNDEQNTIDTNEEYWSQFSEKYSQEEIGSMPTWLIDVKKTETGGFIIPDNIDPNLLNKSQRKAYDIVENHLKNEQQSQLLMIITGEAGSGKALLLMQYGQN